MTTAVIGSIVLRGDEQVPVELRDLAGPRLGLVVGILARRRRQELIQVRRLYSARSTSSNSVSWRVRPGSDRVRVPG